MEFSTAQQAVVNTLQDGGNLSVEEVHPATLKALQNAGVVEVSDGAVFLIEGALDAPDEDYDNNTNETEVDVQPEVEEVVVEHIVILTDPVTIQVDTKGNTITLQAGSKHPVTGFTKERTRRGVLTWIHALHVPSGTSFLVNDKRNTVKIIEGKPLTDFQ